MNAAFMRLERGWNDMNAAFMPFKSVPGPVGSCRAVNLVPPERNREAMDEELIAAMAGGDHSAVRHAFSGRNVMNVEIGDVTRRFGRTQAVAGVTLETGPGVFGLLGPNGAGKTTLLRMMATVIPPSSGRVRLLGRDPGGYGPRREIRRRLGYLPQNLGYYPGFTVAEFVEYFALLKEMPPGRVPQAVAGAIERVDLGGRARAKLRTLSGGMLRRAGIAQAIVNEPELLLLDEPTAGLDPEQRVAFRALLRDLGERATVIVSTHLVEDVGAACSEVGLMDAGKIVFQGTPDELTARGEGTGAAGDAPLERGYSAVLAAARSATAAA
jgi:ABC-type multidrug transport system ATPase subunit